MSDEPDLFGGAYSQRSVLVTGHTGFKGSWLCEWLLGLGSTVSGYALEPPTEPSLFAELGLAERMSDVRGDVRDAASVKAAFSCAAPEVVFHLAAQPLVREGYAEPVYTYETNVMGTVNVLEAVRETPSVRVVVVVTSDKCYENHEWMRGYREDDALGGRDPYSSSKACEELVTAAYRDSFFGPTSPVSVASVRAGNVIGGGDWAADRLVPDCVRALATGEPIEVRNPGAVRPWQHVLEPLAGYLLLGARMLAGDHRFDEAWNFGPADPESLTVGGIADAVVAAWGSGGWTQAPGRREAPREAGVLVIDASKAADRLGWRALYDARRAVTGAVRWYRGREEGGNVADLTRRDIADYAAAAREAGGYPL